MRLLATLALLAIPFTLSADELRGKVVAVADGDTITVLDADKEQHKIRLQHIDAPESKQAFGTKSKEHLAGLVFGKEVVVTWTQRDRYKRILGEVHVGQTNANLEQVKAGFAWHYKQYSKSAEFATAEEEARKAKKGLWADKDPMPPWEFRKKK